MGRLLKETCRPTLTDGETIAIDSPDEVLTPIAWTLAPSQNRPETTDELLYATQPQMDHTTRKFN
jgi:hypothetical protein